jgi:hypothetical protein
MPKWRNEYRRCDNCRGEYRPNREAQSYCSRDCRRAAAYGRERFKAGIAGRRRRRLEASDKEASETGFFPQQNQYPAKRPNLPLLPLSTTGPDARSAGVGSCFREMACRVTCSASRCANSARMSGPVTKLSHEYRVDAMHGRCGHRA